MGRSPARWLATTLAFALLAAAVLGAVAPARADANLPAVYRTCATVGWTAPSLVQQRGHLSRNPRWSTADRSDPAPALEFPFLLRIRSGSISYDQDELGGLWTLRRRAVAHLRHCPFVGGPRRNYEVLLKGWKVVRAELTDAGDLVAFGYPAPGRVRQLHFPGYGNRQGFASRGFTLERTDAPGCAISSLEGYAGTYSDLLGTGLTCAEVRQLQAAIDENVEWSAPSLGFACQVGDTGYDGDRIACADAAGRSLRFGYSEGDY